MIQTSDAIETIESGELFSRVDRGERVNVEGLTDPFPNCQLFWKDGDDLFVKGEMYVERISIQDFKHQLSEIYKKKKLEEYERLRDQISKIIFQQLITEDQAKQGEFNMWDHSETLDKTFKQSNL